MTDLARVGSRERGRRLGPARGPSPTTSSGGSSSALTRRVGGRMAGDHRGLGLGRGPRTRPASGRTSRATTSGGSTGTRRPAACVPQVREDVPGPPADGVAAARHVAVDALRDRRSAQGRRGRGRGARRRAVRRPAIRPPRRHHLRGRRRERRHAAGRRPQRDGRPAPRAREPTRPTRAAARPRWPAPCAPSPRRGRPAGLVTIISDFRGPLDWRAALTAVAARHTVLAIEVVDPREERARRRRRADPHRPRDGPDAAGRHRRPPAPAGLRRGRRRRARGRRRRVPPARRSAISASPPRAPGWPPGPRPRHDWTTDMTFLAPLLLLGLLLVPVLLGLYVWAAAPPDALRGPVHEPGPAREPRAAPAGLAPARPARHLPRGHRGPRVGLARPTMVVATPARGRDRPAGHRRLRLHAGDRRLADPPRRGARGRPRRSSPSCPRASASASSRSPRGRETLVAPTDRSRASRGRARRPQPPGTGPPWAMRSCRTLDMAEQIQKADRTAPTARRPGPSAAPDAVGDASGRLRGSGRVGGPGTRRSTALGRAPGRGDPALRRRQLGRRGRAARRSRTRGEAGRAGLHDRPRDRRWRGRGP